MEGMGEVKAGSGAFDLPISFPRRIGDPDGGTSPEELVAAAHGACYAMALNAHVGRKEGAIRRTRITCTVTAERGEGGIRITNSKLHVVAEGLTGIDVKDFPTVAKEAEGRCPVSNALRANVTIDVEAEAV